LLPSWSTDPTKYLVGNDALIPVPDPLDPQSSHPSANPIETRVLGDIWAPKFRAFLEKNAPEAIEELRVPEEVQNVYQVWNYLRCIVEVAPRGTRLDLARGSWSDKVEEALVALGL